MSSKKFFKIGEVAEILEIPASTLRYWEGQFTILSPTRGLNGQRRYTEKDIETIRKLYFLVKERGLKLDAAQQQLKKNPAVINNTYRAVERLKGLRSKLVSLIDAIDRMKSQAD